MINKKLINISSANSENCWRNRLLLALPRLNAAIATVFLTSAISACATQPEPGAVVAPVPEVAATPVVTPTVVVTATPLVTPTVVVTATPQAGLPNGKLIGETVTVSTKVQRVITPNLWGEMSNRTETYAKAETITG